MTAPPDPVSLVRAAEPDDAEAIALCQARCWQESYTHLLSPGFLTGLDAQLEQRTQMWRDAMVCGRRRPSVAGVGGRVVGMCAAVDHGADDGHPRRWQLRILYLRQAHQGTGLGQELLDAQLADHPAYLWVAENNPRTRAFYDRNRFRPDGEVAAEAEWENLAEIRMVRD